jgi:hypothetical protein
MHNKGPKCVWAEPIFFEKKMHWAKGKQGKRNQAMQKQKESIAD